jgi:hypothetical protein
MGFLFFNASVEKGAQSELTDDLNNLLIYVRTFDK